MKMTTAANVRLDAVIQTAMARSSPIRTISAAVAIMGQLHVVQIAR